MLAKAKHNVKYDGEWRRAGEVFHVDEGDAEAMKAHVEILDETDPLDEPAEGGQQEEPVKRGRKRKADESE